MLPAQQAVSRFQIELAVEDRIGVLTAVTGVFASHKVSISAVAQDHESVSSDGRATCTLRVTTHAATHADLYATIDDLRQASYIAGVRRVIRVEES